jgi:hypothetical protein
VLSGLTRLVQVLDLDGNLLGAGGLRAVVEAAAGLPALRVLDVQRNSESRSGRGSAAAAAAAAAAAEGVARRAGLEVVVGDGVVDGEGLD